MAEGLPIHLRVKDVIEALVAFNGLEQCGYDYSSRPLPDGWFETCIEWRWGNDTVPIIAH